jgi:two-component sensor histidine kinase
MNVMKFVAWRGLSDVYRHAVEGHSPWTVEAKNAQPICIANIDSAELDESLKTTVKAEGIEALAFIPLTAKGQVIGKFMTYYTAPHAFTEAEVALAVTIARQLGFSIERMRAEEQRRAAEEAKQLLLSESRHRIKNTLATVQAIAGQTLRHTPRGERQAFLARLHSLGEAHDLLTSENWDRALLHDVVARTVKPFETSQQDRFVVEGPQIWLSASTALTLTMCLHELATNAAKYGALSNDAGRVHVTWELEQIPIIRHRIRHRRDSCGIRQR